MSELVNCIEYEKFFDEVLCLDKNVRLVAIYDGQFKAKYRTIIHENFEDEEIKSVLSEAQHKWDSGKKLSFKIDNPKFVMARYDKINQISIPLGKEGVILVTTELDADVDRIVDGVIETRTGFFG